MGAAVESDNLGEQSAMLSVPSAEDTVAGIIMQRLNDEDRWAIALSDIKQFCTIFMNSPEANDVPYLPGIDFSQGVAFVLRSQNIIVDDNA